MFNKTPPPIPTPEKPVVTEPDIEATPSTTVPLPPPNNLAGNRNLNYQKPFTPEPTAVTSPAVIPPPSNPPPSITQTEPSPSDSLPSVTPTAPTDPLSDIINSVLPGLKLPHQITVHGPHHSEDNNVQIDNRNKEQEKSGHPGQKVDREEKNKGKHD